MEPDYNSLDPEERTNKFLALLSLLMGLLSLCAGLVPACGAVVSLIGIAVGIRGRKSARRKLANVGIVVSVLGLLIAIVYAYFIYLEKR
jgi:hypothetical protein